MRESGQRVRSTPTRKSQRPHSTTNHSLLNFNHQYTNDEIARSFMINKNAIHQQQKYPRKNEKFNRFSDCQKLDQKPTPFIPASFKQWDLLKKVNKVGLQNFMKEIVLSNNISNLPFTSKLIYAFNKTYLASSVQPHRNCMPSTFGIKRHRISQTKEFNSFQVQSNPEAKVDEDQIKTGVKGKLNHMFPCRKGQITKLLKSRQKTRREKSEDFKKSDFNNNNLESSQKLDNMLRKTISIFDYNKRERNLSSQLSSYCRPASQEYSRQRSRIQMYEQQQYNMVMCKKALIHQ